MAFVERDPAAFVTLAGDLGQLDHNLFLFSSGVPRGPRDARRIDVWWRRGGANLPLALALLRFITRAQEWERAETRFLVVCADVGQQQTLRATLRRHLREARLEAAVRLVRADTDNEVVELIEAESQDAALVLLGLPEPLDDVMTLESHIPQQLLAKLGPTLVYRASSSFEEVLGTGHEATVSFLPPAGPDGVRASLPPLELPATPALAQVAKNQAERTRAWLAALHDDGLQHLYGSNLRLVRKVRQTLERQWGATSRAIETANPKKRRNLLNRAQSTILNECLDVLKQHLEHTLSEQQDILDGRIEALLADTSLVDKANEPLRVERPREDFLSQPGDGRWLRRFKRRRRAAAWILRRDPSYRIHPSTLQIYYRHQALAETVPRVLAQWASDSHRLAARLGKLLHASRTNPALFGRNIDDADLARALREHGQALLDQVAGLERRTKEQTQRAEWLLLVAARHLAADFTRDLDRLDFKSFVRKNRKLPKDAERRMSASLLAHLSGLYLKSQLQG